MSAAERKSKKELLREYRDRKETGGVYAIRNRRSGKVLIQSTMTIEKAGNLLEFSKMTGNCVHPLVAGDWAALGPEAFELEILETLERKDEQTPAEFRDDIRALEGLWKERYPESGRY